MPLIQDKKFSRQSYYKYEIDLSGDQYVVRIETQASYDFIIKSKFSGHAGTINIHYSF